MINSNILFEARPKPKDKDFDFKELDYAKIDNHRQLRTGYPEVVFGQGKTPDQIEGIVGYMLEHDHNILVTRTTEEVFSRVKKLEKRNQSA